MFKVIQTFYDAATFEQLSVGSTVDWTDKARIQAALDRGLIEEVKPEAKAEAKSAEAKKETKAAQKPAAKKAPAKKKK